MENQRPEDAVMSSPIHHAEDLDAAALMYAPPWAREEAQPVPVPTRPSAPPVERPDRAVLEVLRQLALDPDCVPEPPRPFAGDQTMRRIALRMCGVAGIAAAIAWAVVWLPGASLLGHETVQVGSPTTRISVNHGKQDRLPAATVVRLLVHDGRAEPNEPLPAGIGLDGNPIGATIVLSGLAADTRLSAGSPVGTNGWRVDARELDRLMVHAPRAFVGTMDVTIDLRLADNRIADSHVVRLEWTRPAEAPPVPAPKSAPSWSESNPLRLDNEEVVTLVKRGQDFLKDGDLASARLLLRRAVAAGSANAALTLGATFDPLVIQQLGAAIGAEPDTAQAREWYEKAVEFGSAEAPRRLQQLATQVNSVP